MRSSRRSELGLLCCLLFAGVTSFVRADDEVAGEDAQTVTAVFSGDVTGYENEADDIAVAAVYYNDVLYIAATTTGPLEDANVGMTDFIMKGLDSSLEADTALAVQYGGSQNDTVTAIVADEVSTNLVVVGSTYSEDGDDHLFGLDTPTGEKDWFIALLDRSDLSVSSSYVNGSKYDDQEATAVAVTADGEYIVAGWTWGDYFEENAGSDDDSMGYDVWVLKISAELESNDEEFEWTLQFGTVAYDEPTAIVIDDDGLIYVTGTTKDSSGVVAAADEEDISSMWVYCLDPDDGTILWSVTTDLGVITDESTPSGLVISADGSELYVAGHTYGVIPGFDGDSTDGAELFVMGLDLEDGATSWVYQSEGNATAFGSAGIVLADDGSPIIGGIAFGNQFNLSFTYWESGAGDMIAAKIDTDLLEVSKYFVAAAASNLTEEWALAMVSDPDVEDGVFLIGQQDGDFEEDEAPEATLNYLLLKVELEVIPEEEEEDSGPGFDYWPIGVGIFIAGGILFVGAYKWAQYSQIQKAKLATMV